MAKIAILGLITILAVIVNAQEDKYTTKYDNIDIDEILQSERLMQNYVKCIKDEGPCTPDGAEIKRNIGDALQNNCSKCHENQKEGAKKVLSNLINKRKELWEELKAIYDPTGEYTEKYKKEYNEILEH